MFKKLTNLFKKPARAGSIFEQMQTLDKSVDAVAQKISKLGIWIRDDGVVISTPKPPVNSLADAIEYVNQRVDLLDGLVDYLGAKLGAEVN